MNEIHNAAMRIPSIQTLRSFDAACRHQSYSRAGEELGLTHSAISHRIRELETLLGKTLFDRKGNRMVPTAAGRHLHGQVSNALGLLGAIFAEGAPAASDTLTISVFPALSRWLVPRLGQYRADHAGLQIRIHQSSDPVELGNDVDAAVRYGHGDWAGTDSMLLARERLFPVCSPAYLDGHPLADVSDLRPEQLLRHPWHSWESWFHAAGANLPNSPSGPEYLDSVPLIEAARIGEGVALARAMGVVDSLADGSLVRPFDISVADKRSYFFVWPKGKSNPHVTELGDWLKLEFGKAATALAD